MTLKKQISMFGEEGFLSSQEDSHANHTVSQESDLEKKMTDTSGLKCLERYGKFSRHGLWARTFSELLIGMKGWYSTRCSLTWKLKGTKFNRMYFQLRVSTRPTKDTELGLLLTPTTCETVQDLDKFKDRMKKYPNGTTMPNLATQVAKTLLPTPSACEIKASEAEKGEWTGKYWKRPDGSKKQSNILDVIQMSGLLPTPATRDYKGARSKEALIEAGRNSTNSLPDAFSQTGKSSQLNPRFVMEMMGFPPNWTVLPFQSGETNQSKQEETQ